MRSVTEPRDARSLDHKTLEEMRRLAVSRVLAGETQQEVARSLQVHSQTVWKWIDAYRREGESGIESTPATGREPSLSATQQDRLKRTIIGKNPQQLSFGPALWTLPLVQELIEKKFGVVLHKTTVARVLERLGLTPQKPIRRAFQRDDEEVLRWTTTEFPRIVRESRKRQSTLLFLDETGVHEDGPIGTTWGAKGQTPVVRVSGTRRRTNTISAISPRGRLWFRCYGGTLRAPLFIDFLRAMLHDFTKPLDVITDRHPAHVAAAVKRFLHEHRNRIRVRFLPGYAPDLNPDEHVWSHLKGIFRRAPLHPKEDFAEVVRTSMEVIQEDRKLVRSFFDHPEVAYIRKAIKW